ncbi:MAG TPA: microcin C ABC transporter permease YejB [Azospirillaceae bacterium]|nr:microcin C ABC transporter permease YejB [Azospirillaceae bacterium]
MLAYAARRLLLLIPTLVLILAVNFLLVQLAPGGPIERLAAELEGEAVDATARVGGAGASVQADPGAYRGARGLDPELIKELEREFGFDRPWPERFARMLGGYLTFDLGRSFFRDRPVAGLILEKLPVSLTLGLWSTLLIYAASIPLGIAKARRPGSGFDAVTSGLVVVGHAVPGFMVAVLLVVLFAGGSFLAWFPLRGLTGEDWAALSPLGKALDYLHHAALPVLSLVAGGFAGLTLLTRNGFLEELAKPYVVTARAKGLPEGRVLYGHVFRNAMLVVISSFPQALVGVLFTGALMVEVIFSLDGLGLLGFEAVVNRDYPVIFGTLYVLSLMGLLANLAGDLAAAWADPRIDFGARA